MGVILELINFVKDTNYSETLTIFASAMMENSNISRLFTRQFSGLVIITATRVRL